MSDPAQPRLSSAYTTPELQQMLACRSYWGMVLLRHNCQVR